VAGFQPTPRAPSGVMTDPHPHFYRLGAVGRRRRGIAHVMARARRGRWSRDRARPSSRV
jgi:hypothetical protein